MKVHRLRYHGLSRLFFPSRPVLFISCLAAVSLQRLDLCFAAITTTNQTAAQNGGAARPVTVTFTSQIDIYNSLLRTYDKTVRPNSRPSPANGSVLADTCWVNMMIRSISNFDDVNMEYSVQMLFRERWNDARLAHDGQNPYLDLRDSSAIWTPDLFFSNERRAAVHNLLVPNTFVRIRNNGDVMRSIRITMTMACPLDLHFFPMDRPICEIRIGSYGYLASQLRLMWEQRHQNINPVQLATNLTLNRFKLKGVRTGYCSSVTATGSYGCLQVQLFLERELSYYVVQIYVPTSLLIFVSWISFWLEPEAVPARITLGVTTILACVTMRGGIDQQSSPVPYIKASDIWTGMSVVLIVGSLLEYAFVHYMSSMDKYRLQKKQDHAKKRDQIVANHRLMSNNCFNQDTLRSNLPLISLNAGSMFNNAGQDINIGDLKKTPFLRSFIRMPSKRAWKVDFFARWLFPGNMESWPDFDDESQTAD